MSMPAVFTLDGIVGDTIAFFADPSRAVVADVLAGEWNTKRHYGAPRVVIGLGKFQYREPTQTRWAPNSWWDIGGGLVAPVVAARVQQFQTWVHSPAPSGTSPVNVALASREATAALSDATYAAIRVSHGADFAPGDGDWMHEEQGEFVYGAAMWWTFAVPIPVLGDPMQFEVATRYGCTVEMVINGSDTTPDAFGT
jgi:hypothetical protein